MADGERAERYHRSQLVIALARAALRVLALALVLATGVARDVAAAAARVLPAWWWQVAVVAILLGVAYEAVVFPLTWIRGYALPRRYGLLHQPIGSWLADRTKRWLLGGLLGLAAIEIIYGLLRVGDAWSLIAAAVFFLGYVVMAFVFPLWVLPLFYRLRPLEAGPLRDRLLALAQRLGVAVVGVWVADHSRRSITANAAVVGLGRTQRIVLFDTLVASFPPREIEAVVAHELGHHVHHDVRRGLLAQGLITLVTFVVADWALRFGVHRFGLEGPADPAGLPWIVLVLSALGLCAMPLGNAFSRRMEREADDFAVRTTGDPQAFIDAMERLAGLNLAERRPHPVKEILLSSHPSIDRRIARARTVTPMRAAPAATA